MNIPKTNSDQIGLRMQNSWRVAGMATKNAGKHCSMFWNNTVCKPKDPSDRHRDFRGKTIVMIGAESDLGIEAAIKIARLNVEKLIIGVPGVGRGEVIRALIQREAYRNDVFCWVLELDMTSYPSIERFVNSIQLITPKIHAVVLYANHEGESIADNHGNIIRSQHAAEMHLQVNVLSTAYLSIFLLALLLETSLAERSQTRMAFVGCERCDALTPFHDLLDIANRQELSILQYLNKHPDSAIQYPATKFLQMSIMTQLAKRVNSSNVLVFDAEPGFCENPNWNGSHSELTGSAKIYKKIFGRSFEQGSRIIVSSLLCKSESICGQELHGRVWRDDSRATPLKMFRDPQSQECSDNAWAEMILRFRYMRNWIAVKAIVPNGQEQIDAKRMRRLRHWYPRPGIAHHDKDIKQREFPLTSENDVSFWRGTLEDIVPNYSRDRRRSLSTRISLAFATPTPLSVLTDVTEEESAGTGFLPDDSLPQVAAKPVEGAKKSKWKKLCDSVKRLCGRKKWRERTNREEEMNAEEGTNATERTNAGDRTKGKEWIELGPIVASPSHYSDSNYFEE
ncbi:hypothetical protein L207DRAFT_614461 [Hyaloscypha variabilis F]|uniref:NAD(P)-binding protein n=1 Tax=Hyaloscypha variabilis (strain UAMH 11265 / GT02V1 / F) TaxID=1149755 RepID=A0A2J6QW20_HYAVF|nr:hypothetical protein L207DRAFT_614461 [Hyaloscypha variabilis F]